MWHRTGIPDHLILHSLAEHVSSPCGCEDVLESELASAGSENWCCAKAYFPTS